MICTDWRDATAAEIAPLLERERDAWLATLHWDLADSMAIVAGARQAGTLPGWVARDGRGRVRGWTFCLLHDGHLQIGALAADRPATTRALLDAALSAPEAALARGLSCFVNATAPGVDSALARLRFSARDSHYLLRPSVRPLGGGVTPWRLRPLGESDLLAAVQLLASAYAGDPSAACFAPDGRRDQWIHYLGQLLCTRACGQLWEPGTLVADDPATGRLAGLLICGVLSAGTIHVSQVVVDPAFRRRGVAVALLDSALRAAEAENFERITLLVDAANAPAVSLYARMGFERRGRFVFGHRLARRVSRPVSRAC